MERRGGKLGSELDRTTNSDHGAFTKDAETDSYSTLGIQKRVYGLSFGKKNGEKGQKGNQQKAEHVSFAGPPEAPRGREDGRELGLLEEETLYPGSSRNQH